MFHGLRLVGGRGKESPSGFPLLFAPPERTERHGHFGVGRFSPQLAEAPEPLSVCGTGGLRLPPRGSHPRKVFGPVVRLVAVEVRDEGQTLRVRHPRFGDESVDPHAASGALMPYGHLWGASRQLGAERLARDASRGAECAADLTVKPTDVAQVAHLVPRSTHDLSPLFFHLIYIYNNLR